ncbi:MAG TPA: 50S ribosomal protein L11, partial [Candidatus Hodarchaeales archaeon]|nr:50S ribosomal protein L11 [Candidatus Hodarchaeales archaeon]
MSKKLIELKAQVVGGKATAGPPLGPALGPLKVNVKDVINEINKKTAAYEGMTVPIVLKIDPDTKKFDIEVKTPQTSVLLIKEAKLEKGGGTPKTAVAGDLTLEGLIRISKTKQEKMLSKTVKTAVLEILGTARSCALTVDGKDPLEVQK